MIKAIMALDDQGGVSLNGKMPWPKNSNDLKWFKKNTLNQVVIMGRITWIDPFIPTPLIDRVNILITNQDKINYPGADYYISGNILKETKSLASRYKHLDTYIIGGPNILNQLFDLVEEFYLTRIYGNFNCDNKFDIAKINNSMILDKKIESDSTCHFEIWKR